MVAINIFRKCEFGGVFISSKVIYEMWGFNKQASRYPGQHSVVIDNDIIWKYDDHKFLESVIISKKLDRITFILLPQKEAITYINEIGDELERICFNIITYTEIPTIQPVCERRQIIDSTGTQIELRDRLKMHDEIMMKYSISSEELAEKIMLTPTPIKEYKAIYKEIFYILHNPHKVIQYMALYDLLQDKICNEGTQKRQETVRNFLGKNKERYSFVSFVERNDDSDKKEDNFSYLRNNIAHSTKAGIEEFMQTAEKISDKEISNLLVVLNDIILGNVSVE